MKSITLNQRRFLIVWICINVFALFVNATHLEGLIHHGHFNNDLDFRDLHKIILRDKFCLFMDSNEDINRERNEFKLFPFTSHFTSVLTNESWDKPTFSMYYTYDEGFLGIFNGYSYFSFAFYFVLGFAIVFIPKMWSNK